MGVTKMVSLINTFLAQSCMSVRKSGHETVNTTIDIFSSARNKDQKLVGRFLKIGYFIGNYTAVLLKMHGKYGPSKQILVGQMLKLVGKWPVANCYF